MHTVKPVFALLLLVLVASSCLDNTGSDTEPVIEIEGRSNYYIANQNDLDLNVTYKSGGIGIDSTVAVSADSTTKIFEAGGVGGDPPPAQAFASISFYNQSGNTSSPLLTIEPIVNEDWSDLTAKGDTARRYELTITKKDLN